MKKKIARRAHPKRDVADSGPPWRKIETHRWRDPFSPTGWSTISFRKPFDWNDSVDVEAFFELWQRACYPGEDASALIPFTVLLLHTFATLEEVPSHYRGRLWLCASQLAQKWQEIDNKWSSGEVKDIGTLLGRTRQKNWNQSAAKKNAHLKHLAFVIVGRLLVNGASTPGVFQEAARHSGLPVSDSQIKKWFYEVSKELKQNFISGRTPFPAGLSDVFVQNGLTRKEIEELYSRLVSTPRTRKKNLFQEKSKNSGKTSSN